MPLSWNEIRSRATAFSKEWEGETSENAEAKSFWDAFFNIFGVTRRRVATFEEPIKKTDGQGGYIDLLWRGILLVEHKSRGKNLDRAFQQAKDYFPGLKERDLPRYILVSDFARFRLYDLEEAIETEFLLKDLYQNIRLFGFISGYQAKTYKEQDAVNIEAAERMGALHDRLKAIGYTGQALEIYLVRLLFCLFADDTSIFQRRQFQDYIEQRTADDGQDLGERLGSLFENLNIPEEKRLLTLDEQIADFPYVNGSLFAQHLPTAAFDREMRDTLLECCALDWGTISPAIFGALFQSVMDEKRRRNLGAHYTTEKNILKLIEPLFLDELRAEFDRVKNTPKRLKDFHQKLASLKFLDPACGCGNFLVIAYREIRLLELDILRVLLKDESLSMDVVAFNILCDVDQFFGIEIEEFPAQIAQTALWLMDHQVNMQVSEEFGNYFVRLPLKKSAKIIHGNALQIDWRQVVSPNELNYILGNPPFIGAMLMNDDNRKDMSTVFKGHKGYGVLDYVCAWYALAVRYMTGASADRPVKCAFVSTSSITQGEQVGLLWQALLQLHAKIFFAHRTFRWSNEASGKAVVDCVIIGFALGDQQKKILFDYEHVFGEPQAINASNINPYLVDAEDLLLGNRKSPICDVPALRYGNMPRDDGGLLLSDSEKDELLLKEPGAEQYIRPFMSAREFLHNRPRWCLWLVGANPTELKELPEVMARVDHVRKFRLRSKAESTRRFGMTPGIFAQLAQPEASYLLIPRHSSENRLCIPFQFFEPSCIVADSCLSMPGASLFHFGVMSSAMHMAWVRSVCGRIKSDFRYSKDIVFNNFPWPQELTDLQYKRVEEAAQGVLDARLLYPESSLADLYDKLTIPQELVKAHHRLDSVVDAAYSRRKFPGDTARAAYLFAEYAKLENPLVGAQAGGKSKKT